MARLIVGSDVPHENFKWNLLWKPVYLLRPTSPKMRRHLESLAEGQRAALADYLYRAAASLDEEMNRRRRIPKANHESCGPLVEYCARLAGMPFIDKRTARYIAADAFCCLLRFYGITILPQGSFLASRVGQRIVLAAKNLVGKLSPREYRDRFRAIFRDFHLEHVFKRRLASRLANGNDVSSRTKIVLRLMRENHWHQSMHSARRTAFQPVEDLRGRYSNDVCVPLLIDDRQLLHFESA